MTNTQQADHPLLLDARDERPVAFRGGVTGRNDGPREGGPGV